MDGRGWPNMVVKEWLRVVWSGIAKEGRMIKVGQGWPQIADRQGWSMLV